MTCIAGLIDKSGKGHIASDSLGSNGLNKDSYKNRKIFKKGDMLIGYTSSYRMGQLLQYSLVLPKRKVDQSIEEYMYVDFVNAIRELLKINGYAKIESNVEKAGEFLIIYEGRIFRFQPDLALMESQDNFDTCGSGEDFALASIDALLKHTKLPSKTILHEAIDSASRHIATVGGEIQYLTNE